MSEPELLDAETVRQELIDLCRRMPDAVNPRRYGTSGPCVYTDPRDPDRHCLIGQYAAEKGWPMPTGVPGAAQAAVAWGWPLTAEARDVLDAAQHTADAGLLPWGEVPKALS